MTSGFISRSHRAIAPFELHRPTTIDEAAALVGDGAAPHAGGIDLVEAMQQGRAVERVVALDAVRELATISVEADRLVIGATVTHARIETDPLVNQLRPDLAAAWKTVGNLRIRRTGTVGGNLMALDKNYDAAPILAAAGAQLHFVRTDGKPITSAVADRAGRGLLTHVTVPLGGEVVFDRSLKPVVTVAVGPDHIAIGCAFAEPAVFDRPSGPPEHVAGAIIASAKGWLDDADASAAYRRRVAEVLLARALRELS